MAILANNIENNVKSINVAIININVNGGMAASISINNINNQ
jgi:hypothetical protein